MPDPAAFVKSTTMKRQPTGVYDLRVLLNPGANPPRKLLTVIVRVVGPDGQVVAKGNDAASGGGTGFVDLSFQDVPAGTYRVQASLHNVDDWTTVATYQLPDGPNVENITTGVEPTHPRRPQRQRQQSGPPVDQSGQPPWVGTSSVAPEPHLRSGQISTAAPGFPVKRGGTWHIKKDETLYRVTSVEHVGTTSDDKHKYRIDAQLVGPVDGPDDDGGTKTATIGGEKRTVTDVEHPSENDVPEQTDSDTTNTASSGPQERQGSSSTTRTTSSSDGSGGVDPRLLALAGAGAAGIAWYSQR